MLLSRNQKCCRRPPIPMELNLKKEGASSWALLRDTVRSLLIPLAPRRIGLVALFCTCTPSYHMSRVTGHTSWRVSMAVRISTSTLTWNWLCAGHELKKNGFCSAMGTTSFTCFWGGVFHDYFKVKIRYRCRESTRNSRRITRAPRKGALDVRVAILRSFLRQFFNGVPRGCGFFQGAFSWQFLIKTHVKNDKKIFSHARTYFSGAILRDFCYRTLDAIFYVTLYVIFAY